MDGSALEVILRFSFVVSVRSSFPPDPLLLLELKLSILGRPLPSCCRGLDIFAEYKYAETQREMISHSYPVRN